MTRDYAALLSPLCARNKRPEDVRARPWLVSGDGKRWAVATDGWLCVAVLAEPGVSLPRCPGENGKSLTKYIASAGFVFASSVTRAALSRWAGKVKWPDPGVSCARCGDERRVGVKRCCFCGHQRTSGKTWIEPNPRNGSVSGVPVNRVLIARALTVCQDKQILVSVGGSLDPIRFRAQAWRAIVMPIRWDGLLLPALELQAVTP